MLAGRDSFVKIYTDYACSVLQEARLYPKFSKPRLIEARGAWDNDLKRVEEHEPNLTEGLDHFKQAAHLIFWLRRMSPLVELVDTTSNLADSEGLPLTTDEVAFRAILLPYHNEYLAFDFGFQIIKFYELGKSDPSERAETIQLSADYYRTMCHFMKYKTVSPHAINLIYRSLFA